jgi:4-aminobutyrate aminotransferase-like enzyme
MSNQDVNQGVSNEQLTARWQGALMNNYGTPRLPLVRGEGTKLWDADGNEYLDFVGGIAVNALGHAHPAVVEAVTRQISTLGHTSNLYITEPPLQLAEKLLELLGQESARVLFCNSGAEANEAAFKITRRTGRTKIVACENAFHGRTMGALALTGQPDLRLGGEEVRDMAQRLQLGGDGVDESGVGVAEGVHRDATEEVEVLLARLVPDVCTLAAGQHQLGRPERVHERLAVASLEVVGHCFTSPVA